MHTWFHVQPDQKILDRLYAGGLEEYLTPKTVVMVCTVESVQYFLIKLDMKPCMHLVEISIFFTKSCHYQTYQNYEQSRQNTVLRLSTVMGSVKIWHLIGYININIALKY